MKKLIYNIGIVGSLILLLATIFKSMHFPGAAVLLTTGIFLLAFIFLPLAYAKLLKSTSDKLLRFVYHAAFISFFIDFVGMLFKLLHLPGASILLVIAVPLPFIVFLPAYIYYHHKRDLKVDLHFFGILTFMIYLGVISALLAKDTTYKVILSYSHTNEELVATNNHLSEKTYQANKQLNSSDLIDQIEKLKIAIIKEVHEENVNIDNNKLDYYQIRGKSFYLTDYLIECEEFKDFNNLFEDYKNLLNQTTNDNTIRRLIKEIDEFRITEQAQDHPKIVHYKMIIVMNILNDWQNNILLIDYILDSEQAHTM